MPSPAHDPFLEAAIDEARKGFEEGGLPIGSVSPLGLSPGPGYHFVWDSLTVRF